MSDDGFLGRSLRSVVGSVAPTSGTVASADSGYGECLDVVSADVEPRHPPQSLAHGHSDHGWTLLSTDVEEIDARNARERLLRSHVLDYVNSTWDPVGNPIGPGGSWRHTFTLDSLAMLVRTGAVRSGSPEAIDDWFVPVEREEIEESVVRIRADDYKNSANPAISVRRSDDLFGFVDGREYAKHLWENEDRRQEFMDALAAADGENPEPTTEDLSRIVYELERDERFEDVGTTALTTAVGIAVTLGLGTVPGAAVGIALFLMTEFDAPGDGDPDDRAAFNEGIEAGFEYGAPVQGHQVVFDVYSPPCATTGFSVESSFGGPDRSAKWHLPIESPAYDAGEIAACEATGVPADFDPASYGPENTFSATVDHEELGRDWGNHGEAGTAALTVRDLGGGRYAFDASESLTANVPDTNYAFDVYRPTDDFDPEDPEYAERGEHCKEVGAHEDPVLTVEFDEFGEYAVGGGPIGAEFEQMAWERVTVDPEAVHDGTAIDVAVDAAGGADPGESRAELTPVGFPNEEIESFRWEIEGEYLRGTDEVWRTLEDGTGTNYAFDGRGDTYRATVTATFPGDRTLTTETEFELPEVPAPEVQISTEEGDGVGESVVVLDGSNSSPSDDIMAYVWTVEEIDESGRTVRQVTDLDGRYDQEARFESTGGRYEATLRTHHRNGTVDSATTTVDVPAARPAATAHVQAGGGDGPEESQVVLDASGSEPRSVIDEYEWEILEMQSYKRGTVRPVTVETITGETVSFEGTGGEYEAVLTVRGDGVEESTEVDFEFPDVAYEAMSASLSGPSTADPGATETFSVDVQNATGDVRYDWYVAKSGTKSVEAAGRESADVSFGSPDTYTVRVSVEDDEVSVDLSETVTVTDPYEPISVSVSGPTTATEGGTETYRAEVEDATGDVTYDWYVAKSGTKSVEAAGRESADISFGSPDTYTVRVSVEDDEASAATSTTVTVEADESDSGGTSGDSGSDGGGGDSGPLSVSMSGPTTATEGGSEQYSATVDGDTGDVDYDWYVAKSGSRSVAAGSGSSTTVSFGSPDRYTVRVSVEDDEESTATSTTVTVEADESDSGSTSDDSGSDSGSSDSGSSDSGSSDSGSTDSGSSDSGSSDSGSSDEPDFCDGLTSPPKGGGPDWSRCDW